MSLEEKAHERPQEMTRDEWKQVLSPKEFNVAREGGTEPAFHGRYHDKKEEGTYKCVCCEAPLFESDTKYASGSGWPSFYAPREDAPIDTREDRSHGMVRTEAVCTRCGAHLGHVFEDGPEPTGERWCINGYALDFEPGS